MREKGRLFIEGGGGRPGLFIRKENICQEGGAFVEEEEHSSREGLFIEGREECWLKEGEASMRTFIKRGAVHQREGP